ncbi:hypothetical protein II906_03585, partial [bacterium]|nr:hypothetical protein [bacterium]
KKANKDEMDALNPSDVLKIITGKEYKEYNNLSNGLDSWNANQSAVLGVYESKSDINAKDSNGNDIKLSDNHAYSIKSVDDKNVTLIDPHNTEKPIVVDRESLIAISSKLAYFSADFS